MSKIITLKRGGCLECVSHKTGRDGYPRARVNGKLDRVHRHKYREHKGEIPDGLIVRHTCDNRMCCNPEHLLLGTTKDNARDRVERGRGAAGERNGRAKLTATAVKDIRMMHNEGVTASSLALYYKVSVSTIHRIISGKTWGNR